MPPSSSSFESVRGGSSVAMTAESVRNGSHSIIEATASLTRAKVMSNDQSIALRCYYWVEARKRGFWALARGALEVFGAGGFSSWFT